MLKMTDAMIKPMHQMIHEQYEKSKDKLPGDFEARMNKMIDESMKSFPWDDMLQTMVPIYQRHFTKGDIDYLVSFYSTPTGEKILRDMPEIIAESMQAMMPMMTKQIQVMTQNMQRQIVEMMQKQSRDRARSRKTDSANDAGKRRGCGGVEPLGHTAGEPGFAAG